MKGSCGGDPVQTWKNIQADPILRAEYQKVRGMGGFVRAEWDEVNEIIAEVIEHFIWGVVPCFTPIAGREQGDRLSELIELFDACNGNCVWIKIVSVWHRGFLVWIVSD